VPNAAPAAARWTPSGSHVCSLYLFPIFIWIRSIGGGAGEAGTACDGGA